MTKKVCINLMLAYFMQGDYGDFIFSFRVFCIFQFSSNYQVLLSHLKNNK